MTGENKKNRVFGSQRGFSFLEMIIVIAIITIMTMVMFVVSFKDRATKEIETVAREVTAAIRETQNNALTGRQQGSDNLPCAFAFVLSGNSGYKVRGSYRQLESPCVPDEEFDNYGEVLLSHNVANDKIQIAATSEFIVFTVPYGKYIDQDTPNSDGTEIVVSKDGDNRMYHICVHSTGLIEELGFNEAPLACAF
jgi:prepilin-type N-terminal cleavage/methylation domain-containing protein